MILLWRIISRLVQTSCFFVPSYCLQAQEPPHVVQNPSMLPSSSIHKNKLVSLQQQVNTARSSGVPESFISLGNRSPTFGIVVEKKYHRLSVFRLLEDGSYSVVKVYPAVTGKEQGDKKYRGDNRTPEGIYFVTEFKNALDLKKKWGFIAKKYGPRAYVLDYPNIFDMKQRKSGSGIWIHGVEDDRRILKSFDTEGCVALSNADVLEINQYIEAFETPVVIVDEMNSVSDNKIVEERQKILDLLENWRISWEKSDFTAYANFYSQSFYSSNHHKNSWIQFKQNLSFLTKGALQIKISEPKILSFKNQLLVEFLQKYISNNRKDYGRKFLYLNKEIGNYKIIAEKWYPIENRVEVELAVRNHEVKEKLEQ